MNRRRESPYKRRTRSGDIVWVARYTDDRGRRSYAGQFALKRDAQEAIDRAHRENGVVNRPRTRQVGWVYFVGSSATDSPVKVGWALDPATRVDMVVSELGVDRELVFDRAAERSETVELGPVTRLKVVHRAGHGRSERVDRLATGGLA